MYIVYLPRYICLYNLNICICKGIICNISECVFVLIKVTLIKREIRWYTSPKTGELNLFTRTASWVHIGTGIETFSFVVFITG